MGASHSSNQLTYDERPIATHTPIMQPSENAKPQRNAQTVNQSRVNVLDPRAMPDVQILKHVDDG